MMNSTMKLLLSIILGIIISLSFEYLLLQRLFAGFAGNGIWSFSLQTNMLMILRGAIIFCVMLIGIFSKAMWDELSQHKVGEAIHLGIIIRKVTTSKRLWLPIVVSPLIFYPIYILIKTQPDNLVAFIFAYQNGFFWKSLFFERGI